MIMDIKKLNLLSIIVQLIIKYKNPKIIHSNIFYFYFFVDRKRHEKI